MNDFMNIEGWFTLEQGKMLTCLSSCLKENSVIVEIGAYRGRSTCFLAYGIDRKKGIKMYSIDLHVQDKLIENLDFYDLLDKVSIIEGNSLDGSVIEQIPDKIDLLFIDGDHNCLQVYEEFLTYFPKLRKDGVFILHDVGPLDLHFPQFVGPFFVYTSVMKKCLYGSIWVLNKKYETDCCGHMVVGFKR